MLGDAIVNQSEHPVGVFDSGVGGLSVLKDLRAALPNEDFVYVADSGHVPYGDKTQPYIRQRSLLLANFLITQGSKAIVIACNTATAAAATYLRDRFDIPIVAMEPAVKPATAATKSRVVGVLATVGTLANARFAALLERFGHGVRIVVQACPGLVERVEAGDLTGAETRALVERFTNPIRAAGADVIVLGCTHFPFLRPLISEIVGPEITLIDTGRAVAQQLARVLESRDLLVRNARFGREVFWTTGDPDAAAAVIDKLWGKPATVRTVPDPSSSTV